MTSDIDIARLSHWLADNLPEFAPPFAVSRFEGGQSNPTYRIIGSSGSLVLRRKPFGDLLPSAHAIEREHRLLVALHPTGVPVPRPYALCEDKEVIGAAFYVMELVVGRTFWDGALPGVPAAERRHFYESMIDTLAALHAVEIETVGLSDFAPPGNNFARQVTRWSKQYRASQTDQIDAVDRLIEWLAPHHARSDAHLHHPRRLPAG